MHTLVSRIAARDFGPKDFSLRATMPRPLLYLPFTLAEPENVSVSPGLQKENGRVYTDLV
jgi:hypothetical protein